MQRARARTIVTVATLALLLCAPPARSQEGAPGGGGAEERSPAELGAMRDRLYELEEEVLELKRELERQRIAREGIAPQGPGERPPALPAEEGEGPGARLNIELPFSLWLKIGGQLRFRGELRDVADYRVPGTFGRPADDSIHEGTDFVEQRTRLSLDFQVREHVRVLVELQDSRTWGDSAIAADTAEVFVRQGFLELYDLFDLKLGVKIGRYELPTNLADQRLISSLDWSNVTRSWDGAQITFEPEGWLVAVHANNIREGRVFSADGDENDDDWVTGAYISNRMIPRHQLDAFIHWRYFGDKRFSSALDPRGGKEDYTAGFRFRGAAGPVSYGGIAVYQWGHEARLDVEAWAAAAKVGVSPQLTDDVKIVAAIEYAFASGDDDPTDTRISTFDPLFPFGHFYHGHMDLVGWRNLHTTNLQLAVHPMRDLSVHADTHAFWLAENEDAWYDAGKSPVRQAAGRAGHYLGAELDTYVRYKVWKISLWGGYSHFFPGAFVRHTGSAPHQDWWFLLAQLSF